MRVPNPHRLDSSPSQLRQGLRGQRRPAHRRLRPRCVPCAPVGMESPFKKASPAVRGPNHGFPTGVKTTPVNASPVRPDIKNLARRQRERSVHPPPSFRRLVQRPRLLQDVSDRTGQVPPRSAARYFNSLQRSMRRSLSRVFSMGDIAPVRLRALRISAADLTELVAKAPRTPTRWQRAGEVRTRGAPACRRRCVCAKQGF